MTHHFGGMKGKLRQTMLLVLIFFLALGLGELLAQGCVQCRMAPESNMKGGGTAGKNLNTGILYMMTIPYILLMALGVYAFRKRIKSELVKRGILKA